MSDAAEFAALRRVTPAEAVAYLRGRGVMATTTNWQDFWHEEHAQAFTISRLTRLDILQSFHDGLVQSVQGDLSRRDWLKDAKTLLQQTGWWGKNAVTDTATGEQVNTTFNPSRLQLIYDINTGQAAAAGQWARLQAAKRTHPYARYITKRDERVREAHRRWDNLVLPVDHPFWQVHWPPNGWRCRCRAIGVSQREYDRGTTPTGAPMKKEAPEEVLRRYTNPRTGEITDLPVGIDPGFAYNAGVARQQALAGLVKDKLAAADAYLAKQAKAAGFTLDKSSFPPIADLDRQAFSDFFHGRKDAPERFKVAELTDHEMALFGSSQREVWLSRETLDDHKDRHPEVGEQDYLQIPYIVRNGAVWGGHAERRFLLLHLGDKSYRAALKVTEALDEVWFLSLVTSPKQKPPKKAVLLRKETDDSGWRP